MDIPYSVVIHDNLLIKLRGKQIKGRLERLADWKKINIVMYGTMTLSPKKISLWRKF